MENYVQKSRRVASEELQKLLAKPFDTDAEVHGDDEFDPWSLFPVYGSYSSDFDDCAIDVLLELKAKKKVRDDLGAEMFREMLCVKRFCEYGTSPRVCFWDLEPELLDQLISRWTEYRDNVWA